MIYPTIEEKVLKCIKKDGECLNNYQRLLFVYWTEIDHAMTYDQTTDEFTIKKYRLNQLTSPETITRAFRKLLADKTKIARREIY